jgi:hypothetical protein
MPRGRRRPPRHSARRSLQKRGILCRAGGAVWSATGVCASPRFQPPLALYPSRLSLSPSHLIWLSVFAILRRSCGLHANMHTEGACAHARARCDAFASRGRVSHAPMFSAVKRWCPAAMPPQWSCTALHSPRAYQCQPRFCFRTGSAAATQGAHTANGAVPTAPAAPTAPDHKAVSLPRPGAPSASATQGATAARNKPVIAALAKPPPKPERPRLRGSISEQVHAPCAPAVASAHRELLQYTAFCGVCIVLCMQSLQIPLDGQTLSSCAWTHGCME